VALLDVSELLLEVVLSYVSDFDIRVLLDVLGLGRGETLGYGTEMVVVLI
jgi:hypothetical protein